MKKILTGLCLIASAFSLSPVASATPTLQSFGVSGVTGVYNCPYNSTGTECNWSEFTYAWGTTVHTPTSASSIASDARGMASVSGEISPTSYLPTLHAYAYSNPAFAGTPGLPYGGSSRADANVWGVQGYTYTGTTPFLLTLTATLDAVFSSPDRDLLDNHSGFRVSLFDTAGYAWAYSVTDPGADGSEGCPILSPTSTAPECADMPEVYAFDHQELTDTGTISATLSYLLMPGQSFFVGAFLDASVCCGETVDSRNTLEMVFNDASMLTSYAVPGALVPVPEPATLPAALLGLVLLLGLRRART